MIKISPAREAAFGILRRIETDGAFSSALLDNAGGQLSPKDRSLCYELVLGTLRRQMWLDAVIDDLAKGKTLDVEVRIALRLGIYQLRFLERVPAYSAINESVNLVQFAGKTSAKGLVNAVLRRVQRGVSMVEQSDPVAALALSESHLRWLVEKWIGDRGFEDASELIKANNRIPVTAFRTTASSTPDTVAALADVSRSEFTEGCFLAESIDDRLLELAAKNEIYFQDEASQMVANAVSRSPGGRFLDVCAAPGSKATLVAYRSQHAEAATFIVAGDRYDGRIRVLKSNCANQGVSDVNIVQYDAEQPLPFADQSFQSVLVDAPCSGTGTIRHNPEIRYRVTREDFAELSKKQLSILQNASKLVVSGGELVYSTCSIEPEENEEVCQRFLESAQDFSVSRPQINERFITTDGYGRTFPHRDRMDGFFIASFRRR
ncbi:MAG: 16S rRNA (cytosine(967)-C(5))-methyltransferase RsmB [Acidobacteriota bacterium]